jgi:hypothetical protein
MVMVKTNSDIIAEEEAARKAADATLETPYGELAQYLRSVWADAKETKEEAEDIMEQNIRQRNGIYEAAKLEKIKEQGGSEIYMLLTDEKCTALKSWLYDLLLPPNDNPYDVSPTPLADLPDDQMNVIRSQAQKELMQELLEQQQLGMPISEEEIQSRMLEIVDEIKELTRSYAEAFDDRMKDKIDDVIVESAWRHAFAEVIDDIVDLPAGILKGPIIESHKKLKWQKDVDNKFTPVVDDEVTLVFKRVSPFDIYPVGASTGVNDGDMFEKHRLTLKDLEAMKKVEDGGYQTDTINLLIAEIEEGRFQHWADEEDSQNTSLNREQEEDDTVSDFPHEYGKKVEALQFWGSLPMYMVKEYGIEVEGDDSFEVIDCEVWMVGPYILKAKANAHPLGLKPYHKASFRKRNGSYWGEGLPQVLSDIQDICNATARSLVNNMAISSGPQVGVDNGRIAEGENVTSIFPWKIWQFDEQQAINNAGGRPPLWFFQPDNNASALMAVYEFFSKEADNKSGVPRYSYGTGGGTSALGTATGMTMMMNNASKGIKQVVKNIDYGIIEPSIRAIHTHIMLWDDDESLKGDIKINATGSTALLAKEQMQVRLNEALNIASTEVGLSVIGEEGLAAIFRAVFKGLDADIEGSIPSKEDIQRRIAQKQKDQMMIQQMQQMGGMMGGQAPAPVGTDQAGNVAGGGDVNMYQQTPMR